MTTLVIVESPAKAKTLAGILGPDYQVEASYGHVRDLPESAGQIPTRLKKEPWARLGVNVEQDFEPLYIVPSDKKKHIERLRKALKKADSLLLATDEDREGESISWHVVELLEPKVPIQRIVFHEITDEAIHEALTAPRDIDSNLVRAQESRRIIDRLFGYGLSPVLWKKVRPRLSAGRVQSVAVRLCVERERERQRFRAARYGDIEAEFEKDDRRFTARLARVGATRVATGQDFDAETGNLKTRAKAQWLQTEEEIRSLLGDWPTPWSVSSIEEKPLVRRPSPPFTTSSLQQEANRKLRFSARHTMRVAQRLYEGVDIDGDRVGLITYMRTDSVTLAERALHEAQHVIGELFGAQYTGGARRYRTKSRSAQEAHEAIRPTLLARTPDRLHAVLNQDELRLYELIWRRTLASQMPDAQLRKTVVEITATSQGDSPDGIFSATGTTIDFPGFLKAYDERADRRAEEETILPPLVKGEPLIPIQAVPKIRETLPPARYTEASLVKKLEAEGIGRPSTYAPTLDTIQQRGYVIKHKNALIPTFTAFAVTELLENHFSELVDTGFTARMEAQLDEIASGKLDWKTHLRGFYYGEDVDGPGLEAQIEAEEPRIEFPRIEVGLHPETGRPIVIKVGRYGPYLQQEDGNGERIAASLPDDMAPADLSIDEAATLLERATQGAQLLGHHPETEESVYLAHGRFGHYVQLGESPERGSKSDKPKRASLPKGFSEEDVTLELAVKWLSLPRTLGVDPESGVAVTATRGRFGPFIKRGDDTRSLGAADDVFTISLERALELLAQPKPRRGGRRVTRQVLRDFGDGEGGKIQLLEGPYGPYLSNGELNASLPKGQSAEDLQRDEAERILRERGKAPKRRRTKSKK